MNKLEEKIPDKVYSHFVILHNEFLTNEKKIRLVGGAVRDILIGNEPNDYDFATDATPDEIEGILKKCPWIEKIIPTGKEHGTLTVIFDDESEYEITTLRIDTECDGRHAQVEFTDDWEQDAARRDFTINAMFMDVDGRVYDFFTGIKDLNGRKVRFVGSTTKRIEEDALRIMRFFRFQIKMGLEYEDREVRQHVHLLENISKERILDEIKKVLKSNPDKFEDFLHMLHDHAVSEKLKFPIYNNTARWSGERNYKSKIPEVYMKQYPFFVIAELSIGGRIQNFMNTWPISNEEKKQIEFILKYRFTTPSNQLIEDLIMKGYSSDWIIPLLHIWEVPEKISLLSEIEHKEFPIRGQDFLNAGLTEGQEIGIMIDKAKCIWEMSRYKMEKTEILKMLGYAK